jgi:TRAP-type mannitol/chloroaromatic compound transport system permease small subunit
MRPPVPSPAPADPSPFVRAADAVSEYSGRAVRWLVAVMVLVGAFNAVARYLGRGTGVNLSSNAYIELQWYLFSIVFLLGVSYALKHDAHVRVDVLYGRLGPRGRAWIDLLGTVLFLIPFSVFMLACRGRRWRPRGGCVRCRRTPAGCRGTRSRPSSSSPSCS